LAIYNSNLRALVALVALALLTPAAGAQATPVPDPYTPYEGARQPETRAGATPALPPVETPAHEQSPLGAPTNEPAQSAGPPSIGFDVARTAASLAIVIALILALRLGLKRLAGGAGKLSGQFGAGGRAPSGILSVIGRYPIARGQTLVLLKLDTRILLLSQTSEGFQTLAEISDPDEVASILTKSRDEQGDSMASRFTSLLRQAERDPRLADEHLVEVEEPRIRSRRRAAARPADDLGVESWDESQETPRQRTDAIGALKQRLAWLTEGGR